MLCHECHECKNIDAFAEKRHPRHDAAVLQGLGQHRAQHLYEDHTEEEREIWARSIIRSLSGLKRSDH